MIVPQENAFKIENSIIGLCFPFLRSMTEVVAKKSTNLEEIIIVMYPRGIRITYLK